MRSSKRDRTSSSNTADDNCVTSPPVLLPPSLTHACSLLSMKLILFSGFVECAFEDWDFYWTLVSTLLFPLVLLGLLALLVWRYRHKRATIIAKVQNESEKAASAYASFSSMVGAANGGSAGVGGEGGASTVGESGHVSDGINTHNNNINSSNTNSDNSTNSNIDTKSGYISFANPITNTPAPSIVQSSGSSGADHEPEYIKFLFDEFTRASTRGASAVRHPIFISHSLRLHFRMRLRRSSPCQLATLFNPHAVV